MHIKYNDIISVENLLLAWQEFQKGKKYKNDVAEFSLNLMQNIFEIHDDLKNKNYKHGRYQHFKISDSKPRDIHKATVKDRLIHHAIYRILYPYFDKKFIYDSYSCRNEKGTHKAINRFRHFSQKVSQNHTKACWVLKCDIKKFFASIDHTVLKRILSKNIVDQDILWLLNQIIDSFETKNLLNIGLPLGNLTSQLLVNVYMNEFDCFVKRELRFKYYIRYADDFVFLSGNKLELQDIIPKISTFLSKKLKLKMHPNKVFIKKFSSGVDFLGWVHFSDHRIVRTSTRRRMFQNMQRQIKNLGQIKEETRQSYLGLLKHGGTFFLQEKIKSF